QEKRLDTGVGFGHPTETRGPCQQGRAPATVPRTPPWVVAFQVTDMRTRGWESPDQTRCPIRSCICPDSLRYVDRIGCLRGNLLAPQFADTELAGLHKR